jgi:hypothetical protein
MLIPYMREEAELTFSPTFSLGKLIGSWKALMQTDKALLMAL